MNTRPDQHADDPGGLTRDNVLSVTEVAELLGLARSTVHDLARRGLLPARRVGRRWLFLRDRIEAALRPLEEPGAWRPLTRDERLGDAERSGAPSTRPRTPGGAPHP